MFPRNLRGWSPDSKEDGSNVIQNHIVHLCHGKMGEQCQTHLLPRQIYSNPMCHYHGQSYIQKKRRKKQHIETDWNPPSPQKKRRNQHTIYMAKKQTYWTHLNPTAPTTFSFLGGSVDHRWSANFHDVKPRRDPAPERACRMTAAATRHKGELANSDTPSFAAQTQRIGKNSWLKKYYTRVFEFFSSLKWVWEWFYGNTSTCSWTKVAQPIGVKLA